MVMAVVVLLMGYAVITEGLIMVDLDFGGGGEVGGRGGGGNSSSGRGVVGPATLVLDREKGELVKAPVRIGRRGVGGSSTSGGGSEVRAAQALKSHSDAERRRRERINSHLSTLRGLLPTTVKMDKAAVLAEVIKRMKQLKRAAAKEVSETCTALNIPSCTDEVQVENYGDDDEEEEEEEEEKKNVVKMKASISCDDRPEIFSDLRRIFETLRLRMVSSEISTMGTRLKTVFVLSTADDNGSGGAEGRELIINSVRNSLRSVVEGISTTSPPSHPDSSPATSRSGKKRKFSSTVESMSCSS